VSSGAPAIDSDPLDGVHLIAFGALMSVHITMLSVPVKHGSLTVADPPLSVARPAQAAPDDMVKPPIGLHDVIVVGGTAGGGATCRHPQITSATTASIGTIQRIPASSASPLQVGRGKIRAGHRETSRRVAVGSATD
jgi:hypothetical protein